MSLRSSSGATITICRPPAPARLLVDLLADRLQVLLHEVLDVPLVARLRPAALAVPALASPRSRRRSRRGGRRRSGRRCPARARATATRLPSRPSCPASGATANSCRSARDPAPARPAAAPGTPRRPTRRRPRRPRPRPGRTRVPPGRRIRAKSSRRASLHSRVGAVRLRLFLELGEERVELRLGLRRGRGRGRIEVEVEADRAAVLGPEGRDRAQDVVGDGGGHGAVLSGRAGSMPEEHPAARSRLLLQTDFRRGALLERPERP